MAGAPGGSAIEIRMAQLQDQMRKDRSATEEALHKLETEVQRSRRDMDQGLLVLTELSHEVHSKLQGLNSEDSGLKQVQQELADQQDAMDALMDMLEKTITVEVCWSDFPYVASIPHPDMYA